MLDNNEPYEEIVALYDAIRPSYPEKLIKDIIVKTNLKLNHKILEIEAGTGKATVQFAKKGYSIYAIENNEALAKVFKESCSNYHNVSMDIDAFDNWKGLCEDKYKLIYSTEAFYWLKDKNKFKKCHDLLSQEGYLALFWYNSIDNYIDNKFTNILKKYSVKIDETFMNSNKASVDYLRKQEIERSNLFQIDEIINYKQIVRKNPEQYINIIKKIPQALSNLSSLDERSINNLDLEIEEEINKNGGYIESILNFSLYITKPMKILDKKKDF